MLPQGPGAPSGTWSLEPQDEAPQPAGCPVPDSLKGPLALIYELTLASGGTAARGPQNLEEGWPSGRLPVDVVSSLRIVK